MQSSVLCELYSREVFLWRGKGNEFWEETAACRMNYKQTLHGKPNFCNCRAGPATTRVCFSVAFKVFKSG